MNELEKRVVKSLHDILFSWELIYYSGYRSSNKSALYDYSMVELHILHIIENNGGSILREDLIPIVGMKPSTVSSIINRLIGAGCIIRRTDENDARKSVLLLSEHGRSINQQHELMDEDMSRNFLSRVSEQDAREFVRICDQVTKESLISPRFSAKYRSERKSPQKKEK